MLSESLLCASQIISGSFGAPASVRSLHVLNGRNHSRRSPAKSTRDPLEESWLSALDSLQSIFATSSPQQLKHLISSTESLASSLLQDTFHPRYSTKIGRYLSSSPLNLNTDLLIRRTVNSFVKNGQSQRHFSSKRRSPASSLFGSSSSSGSTRGSLTRDLDEKSGPLSSLLKRAKILDNSPLKVVTEEHIKKYMNTETKLSDEEYNRARLAFLEGYLVAEAKSKPSRAASLFRTAFSFGLTLLLMALFLSIVTGTLSVRMMMGLNPHEIAPEDITVTFNDVKGVDEAKDELQQVVHYLKDPTRFSALGGKLPKGVLLVGPPGTGKTLLARAVAGEAGVPFFQVAGSEFDEILVGQGARRVRDLFAAAKERAPCVIFIDEIDAVGSKRTNSVLHPHANQTINQLLAEMDGFHQNEGVIVLGATNRQEDLDKALTRPGRFDVQVQVPMPDLKGRLEILRYYLDKLVLGSDVKMEVLARGTTGFTGADIENMVNQAALAAAADGMKSVTMPYLERARDKVIMGPAKKSKIPDDEANWITAYHEGGHTLVAHYTKDAMPLHKVTIIPRGPSLGHTAYMPEKEMYHQKKSEMLAMLDTLLAGRAAEELIFGAESITSGAADDLRKASELASHMVKMYGFSDKAGLRWYGRDEERDFLMIGKELGPATAETIDSEIKRILQESYERAKSILKNHGKEHKFIAEALMEHETLDADEIRDVINGLKLPKKEILY